MQCQTEEDCTRVVKCLPPTEAALLEWAINLMADVVQEEQANKMNARNIAMVFAPNMTQVGIIEGLLPSSSFSFCKLCLGGVSPKWLFEMIFEKPFILVLGPIHFSYVHKVPRAI
jgi:RhoGAP domain